MRDDLVPFYSQTVSGYRLHIYFERLDTAQDFNAMKQLLKREDGGYLKQAEFLAFHVRHSDILGWNVTSTRNEIQLLKDILPVAGAGSVKITGLSRQTHLNDQVGHVIGLTLGQDKTARFAVTVPDMGRFLFKPSNLCTVF